MRRNVSLTTRRELSAAISERYRAADRQSKKAILDEFVTVTGDHRKHAIRMLSGKQMTEQKRPVGKRIYHAAVDEALIVLWEAADRICGKRLKALLPALIEAHPRGAGGGRRAQPKHRGGAAAVGGYAKVRQQPGNGLALRRSAPDAST